MRDNAGHVRDIPASVPPKGFRLDGTVDGIAAPTRPKPLIPRECRSLVQTPTSSPRLIAVFLLDLGNLPDIPDRRRIHDRRADAVAMAPHR